MLIGLICIAIGFPADGLIGGFFSLSGIALVWIGWAKERRDREGGAR
jgi:hypothetical protein